jgi:murein DD-endopeptidase MepM/ murein hydrolase activator NlpD
MMIAVERKTYFYKFVCLKRKTIYSFLHRVPFIALLSCFTVFASAQPPADYPRNYFRWPLNLTPQIVANLGELRPNHWHMGLDIRTNQKENQPVYAAAAGYISRVRIEKSGFGRSIFITHPNGYTTLYGHLNNYFPQLEEYVTAEQYKNESWTIDLQLPRDKFPVTKGQFIAYSGNTGGSQGPHLHFEIRDTKTDECLNPLFFGLPLQDNVAPSLYKLALYDRSKSIYESTTKFFSLKKTPDGYIIPKQPVIKTGSRKVSFGLQAIDRITGSSNEDGIYSAELFFDGEPVVKFALDRISYETTGYLNAHIDYKYRYNGGPFFQLLSQLPGERSGVYNPETGSGVITLNDAGVHEVRVEVKDARHNTSQLRFAIQYDERVAITNDESPAQKFIPNYANVLKKPAFEIHLPETALYDTVTSYYFTNNNEPENAVSAPHQVNDPSVPVHNDITVRIRPTKTIPPEWRNKIVIQRSYRNSRSVQKATWEGEWLSAKFSDFGTFQAFVDLKSPELNELGSGDTVNLSAASRIVFRPEDNFGSIKSFRAELDGQWLRFTNDKGWSHIYIFDERCPYGVHQLKVTVEDQVGNVTTKTWWFKKYPYTPPKKKVVKKKKATKKKAKR